MPLGEWNLRQFWNITSGIIMLLFVYTTTRKRMVIFTCRYFKLSWNTAALSQSNRSNFSCSSIKWGNELRQYVHTILDSLSCRHEKLSRTVWTVTARDDTSRSHSSNWHVMVLLRLAESVWCTRFQPSLLSIYFSLNGFQSSLLLI